ncbi:MAG: ATP-dependent Clp protease adaptor ClpS [Deltaproteobacteria bacterium]|nr:ATP-dependent Clp protease adaptor ClpS [Deltaproteobacteria bacterium]
MAQRKGSKPPADPGWDTDGEQAIATETDKKVERPRLYNVLLHNDNYTTMEFVVMVLMTVFHHAEASAVEIMLHVHQKGVGVAGTYPYEIAEAKSAKVTRLAREHEFPLRTSLEPA